MKGKLTILALWLACSTAYGQGPDMYPWNNVGRGVQPIEAEVFAGYVIQLTTDSQTQSAGGGSVGAEVRFNCARTPLDLGLQAGLHGISRELPATPLEGSETRSLVGKNASWKYRTTSVSFLMDWNFRQGHKFNPFAGLGVGLAHHHIKDAKLKDELKEYVNDVKYFKNDGVNSVIFSPRLGVELFRHCRLTATVRISKKYFNSLQLTAGATFGGRPKK